MADDRTTLTLALPARCDDALSAAEKWLLAVWQASSKRLWRFVFDRAPIALEYRAKGSSVAMGAYLSNRLLSRLSRSMLPSLVPGIDIEAEDVDLMAVGSTGAICTFQLRSPGWVELPKDVAPTSINAIIGALSHLADGDEAIVQLLLNPTWMTTDDGRQPAFWLAGRIAVRSKTSWSAQQHVRVIASAFGQFAGFNGVHFSRTCKMRPSDVRALTERRWIRRVLPSGHPATPAQVAQLFHPPEDIASDSTLLCSRSLKTPATTISNDQITLGEGRDLHGVPSAVGLVPDDLLRHALVIGPSGAGKTTLLASLARELASAGHGVTVIDPHGSLVRGLARTLPASRVDDAALLSFADVDYPVALNPLRARPGMEFAAADEFVEVVERVYGSAYWGPLLDLVLRHAALAAIELGGSLVESARLLDDPYYRDRALARIGNSETVRVLGQLGTTFDRRLLPAINRLQRLLGTPWLRNILGQTGHGIGFAEIFDRNQIALFDLSGIGATNARLLGSLLLLLIRQATLGRAADRSQQTRHFVLIDEASWFLSRTVAELYDQARKFGVGIVLAVQRAGQLAPEDTREAVLSNAANLITFRINDREEASFLARHLASDRIAASDLQHLPRHEAYVQTTRDGQRLEPAWFHASAPPSEPANAISNERTLLAAARLRYARPRALVEAELRLRDRPALDYEEPEVRRVASPAAFPANAA